MRAPRRPLCVAQLRGGAWQPCGVPRGSFRQVASQGSNFCTAARVQHVQRAARRAAASAYQSCSSNRTGSRVQSRIDLF